MSTKGFECWAPDNNAHALRIELSGQPSLLLPFDQFIYADHRQESGGQQLRMVFGTHEVVVRGHTLRRIVTALQRLELAFITPLPASVRTTVPDGQPVIREIEVTEVTKLVPQTP